MRPDRLAYLALRRVLPFQSELRKLKRRLLPYEDDPGKSHHCVVNGLELLAALREASIEPAGADVLEFGSGWLPLIPMLFHLAGARRVVLTDIDELMDARTIERARAVLRGHVDRIAASLGSPREAVLDRLEGEFRHDYLVPWDVSSHPAASVDIVVSRAVFEHVPRERLEFFLGGFHRILRPGGCMCHLIDNSDHWQQHSPGLSRLDFLRYEDADWVWRIAQLNEQAYLNRLRHSDYAKLFTDAGFTIAAALGQPDAKALADLDRIPLSTRFAGKSHDDLATLTSLFVVKKAS